MVVDLDREESVLAANLGRVLDDEVEQPSQEVRGA